MTNKLVDVAIIGNFDYYYSGSNYYEFFIGVLLSELNYNVRIYSDQYPVMYDDFCYYNRPIIDEYDNANYAGVYIGTPSGYVFDGTIKALELAAKYNKPVFLPLYDCPSLLNKTSLKKHAFPYIKKCEKAKEAIHKYKQYVKNLNILILTKNTIKAWSKYLNLSKKYFKYLEPTINYKLIDQIPNLSKKNWIVAIGRNDKNKNWNESLEILDNLPKDYELHIIGSPNPLGEFKNHNKCVIHSNIDDKEKFEIIKQSKLLISNSIFEGFGIPIVEALYCGVPVVCYDLMSLKNVKNNSLYKIKCFKKDKFLDTVLEKISNVSENKIAYEKTYQQSLKEIQNIITIDKHKTYKDFNITLTNKKIDTKQIIHHFDSIYSLDTQYSVENFNVWNQLFNNSYYSDKIRNHNCLNIFTINNTLRISILELVCSNLKLDINVLSTYDANDIKNFLKSVNVEYSLFINAFDSIISNDPIKLIDFCEFDQIIFGATSKQYYNNEICSQQADIAPLNATFKYLNPNIFFGKTKDIINMLENYDNFGKMYIDNPELVKLDFYSQYIFSCDDSLININTHVFG